MRPGTLGIATLTVALLAGAPAAAHAGDPAAVSLMPDGLVKALTRQQPSDLLEFLCRS
jgi:hypothetical protein